MSNCEEVGRTGKELASQTLLHFNGQNGEEEKKRSMDGEKTKAKQKKRGDLRLIGGDGKSESLKV